MWTLTQLPSISAPVFKSPGEGLRGNLPFGLQIVARRYNDPLMLKFVAEAVERGHLPRSSYEQAYGVREVAATYIPYTVHGELTA